MRASYPLSCATACLLACEVEPTQLVVVVQTDMIVPSELDGFVVRVRDGRGRLVEPERTFDLEGEGRVTLPATFGVAPRDRDPARRVTVEVDAMLDGARRFDSRARTGFVENETLRLDLWLAGRCVIEGATCSRDEETCSLDGCVDLDVPPADLPAWDGLDAGAPADAAPQTDGGSEVVETGTEVIRGNTAFAVDVVVGPDHAAYVAGFFLGEVDVDGDEEGPLVSSTGAVDTFVTKVGLDGVRAWTMMFGDEGSTIEPRRLTWSSTGNLLVSATADGNATLCGSSSNALLDVPVVLEIEPADGACLGAEFAEPSRATSRGESQGLVELDDGSRATAGWFRDGLALGGELLEGAGMRAFFVAQTELGQTCSIVAEGSATSQSWALSADLAGGLLLGAGFGPAGTSATFGANSVTGLGAYDAFFAGVDTSCAVGWFRTLSGELVVAGVEALDDGSDQVLAVGTSVGLLTFGDLWLTGLGGSDVFAARMSPNPDFVADEFALLGGASDEELRDAAAYDGTAILVAGRFSGTTELHGSPVESRGTSDGFVLAIDAQLEPRWFAVEAGNGADTVSAVTWDEGDGTVVATGESAEGLWLGDDRLDPVPFGQLVFLHRFRPVED